MIRPAEALVLDASVAAKWYLTDEQYAAEAIVIQDRLYEGEIALFAPRFILLEVRSAIIVAIPHSAGLYPCGRPRLRHL